MSAAAPPRRLRRLLPAAALALCLAGCSTADHEPAAAVEQVREAEGATLRLTLDRRELTTVETLLLTLEVEAAEADRVAFPNPSAGFGEFQAAGDRPAAARLGADGRVTRGHSYTLEPFLPGDVDIPSLAVVLNGSTEIETPGDGHGDKRARRPRKRRVARYRRTDGRSRSLVVVGPGCSGSGDGRHRGIFPLEKAQMQARRAASPAP